MRAANPRDPDGDPEGTVFAPGEIVAHASLVLLVKEAADRLEREYPGWLWAIQPDERGRIVNIFSMRLSGKWGYTLKIERLQNDPQLRHVIRAAGELLERFGFRAGPYESQRDQYRGTPLHLGQHRADVSDLPGSVRKSYRSQQIRQGIETGHAGILTDASIGAALRDVRGD